MHLYRTNSLIASAILLLLSVSTSAAEAPVAPDPRTRTEVDAVLKKAPAPIPEDKLRPLNILLLAGKKDHGKGEHDYPLWQKNWAPLVSKLPKVKVDTAFDWPKPEQIKAADLMVCFLHPVDDNKVCWNDAMLKDVDSILERGGGVVLLHWAIGPTKDQVEKFGERFGLAYTAAGYRHGPIELKITAGADNPITRGFPPTLQFFDEAYFPILGDASKVTVLASVDEFPKPGAPAKENYPQIWTKQHAKGRAFSMIPGHYNWSFNDPFFRLLLLRGMAWAAGEPEQRFDALALDGVEFKKE